MCGWADERSREAVTAIFAEAFRQPLPGFPSVIAAIKGGLSVCLYLPGELTPSVISPVLKKLARLARPFRTRLAPVAAVTDFLYAASPPPAEAPR